LDSNGPRIAAAGPVDGNGRGAKQAVEIQAEHSVARCFANWVTGSDDDQFQWGIADEPLLTS
jgi:hypothetical protein